jgi:hypothetical protein
MWMVLLCPVSAILAEEDPKLVEYQQALTTLTAALSERQAEFDRLSKEKRDRILAYAITMVDVTPQMFDSAEQYRPVVDRMTADYERFYAIYSAARAAVREARSHVDVVRSAMTLRLAELGR